MKVNLTRYNFPQIIANLNAPIHADLFLVTILILRQSAAFSTKICGKILSRKLIVNSLLRK